MIRSIKWLAVAATLSTMSMPVIANAQAFSGFAGQMAMINMQHSVLQRSVARQSNFSTMLRTPKISNLTAQSSAALIESFNFSTSSTRRRANLSAFVERLRPMDAAGSAELAKLFASRDVLTEVASSIQSRYGLRGDNVADAFATWWAGSWLAAKGRTDELSRGTMQAVRRQAMAAFAANPVILQASDAMKQEMAETLLLQVMLTSDFADSNKSNPDAMRQLGAAVRKGAMASGLDLDSMTLTEQGFVPAARETGAAEGDPAAPDEQLAAATPAPSPANGNDNAPPYALIAAAGGAGLGGVFLLGKYIGRRG